MGLFYKIVVSGSVRDKVLDVISPPVAYECCVMLLFRELKQLYFKLVKCNYFAFDKFVFFSMKSISERVQIFLIRDGFKYRL